MSDEEKFDAIIIGAGPAGSACAYVLAREGKNVLLIERGDSPAAKTLPAAGSTPMHLNLSNPDYIKKPHWNGR